jgi:hypothetical protein
MIISAFSAFARAGMVLLKGRRSGLLTGRLGSQRLRTSETPFKRTMPALAKAGKPFIYREEFESECF